MYYKLYCLTLLRIKSGIKEILCQSQNTVYRCSKFMGDIGNHLIFLFVRLLNFHFGCSKLFLCLLLLYNVMNPAETITACALLKLCKIRNNREACLICSVCNCLKTNAVFMTYKVYLTIFQRHACSKNILHINFIIHGTSEVFADGDVFFAHKPVSIKK